ncbi:MAG: hypothetical protein OI74_07500 [Gammaproteobacteria bacterium (ex Lamellibrachia satsuma)]|nr:MAG: tetratricopeptide repeat protein [Gammaproteobacteria bacterium (ex Lamellibrachia satsuma)]RRS33611.1 MAG: hypothetical protein OI74_07500 [Gammaproteobacteria bacterium (ex Lamellibrachia satsuma)]RRS37613.1 MAG: hypothetical protein NV67_00165 [Gammaproteobacteria bacterium (ex Lamellibrachia satsuma)]
MDKNDKKLSLDDAVKLAVKLHREGQVDDARTLYQRILEAAPTQPDALHYLGVLQHQAGREEEAVKLIRGAIKSNPAYREAHNNLGNVLKELGRLDEAKAAYRGCLALDPKNADALNNLGTALREQTHYQEAMSCYRKAIEISPEHADVWHNIGSILVELERYEEAIDAYRKAISFHAPNSASYRWLGYSLYRQGRLQEAVDVFRKWLLFDPDNPVARHLLAACTGENVPERASDAFVEETFDKFAGSFDKVLKKLEYRAPELLAEAVASLIPQQNEELMVLDAGCGTGWCGPLLRPYARRLVGVDLSRAMLEKAKGCGIYDELIEEELTSYIQARKGVFNLIVSADTLCYFGALEEVTRASFEALKPGGLMLFSIEKIANPQPGNTFILRPHGRYSHAENYLRNLLSACGFDLISIENQILRKEAGRQVEGLIVSVMRPPGQPT